MVRGPAAQELRRRRRNPALKRSEAGDLPPSPLTRQRPGEGSARHICHVAITIDQAAARGGEAEDDPGRPLLRPRCWSGQRLHIDSEQQCARLLCAVVGSCCALEQRFSWITAQRWQILLCCLTGPSGGHAAEAAGPKYIDQGYARRGCVVLSCSAAPYYSLHLHISRTLGCTI
jgi:hypothetical protein